MMLDFIERLADATGLPVGVNSAAPTPFRTLQSPEVGHHTGMKGGTLGRIVRPIMAAGIGLSLAATGCTRVTYRVSRADYQSAALVAASQPHKRMRAVRYPLAVFGLLAADVARGSTNGNEDSDTVFLEYQDPRDVVWGVGLGIFVASLTALPFAISKTSPRLPFEDRNELHPTVPSVVGALVVGGLMMLLWGSLAESPLPSVAPWEESPAASDLPRPLGDLRHLEQDQGHGP